MTIRSVPQPSSSEAPPDRDVDTPATGAVRMERNMPTDLQRIRPHAPWNVSKADAAAPMQPLGGQFAVQTALKFNYLTAVGGGGKTTDVIHTDAFYPRAWEEFRLWVDSAGQNVAFQTFTGNFITAVDAGGLTTDAIHSDATAISTWEMFKLLRQSAFPDFAIQTLRGFFLTAVGGGGHNSGDTIHTDALTALEWERFNIFRRLDFGSGSTYGIWAGFDPENPAPLEDGFLGALYGGGPNSELYLGAVNPIEVYWTLLKQDDGTYALQSSSGRVLTANSGGLPGAGFRIDATPDQIGNFEKFTIVDGGEGSNFTARIKTYTGTYLARDPVVDTNDLVTVSNPNDGLAWQFQLMSL